MVFVSQHGAAKSVLAAALLERLAAEQGVPLRALARGSEPEPQVAPAVAAGLLAEGVDVDAWQPRLVTHDDLAPAWRIISLDNIPAVANSFPAAQAAIAARLPELIQGQPE